MLAELLYDTKYQKKESEVAEKVTKIKKCLKLKWHQLSHILMCSPHLIHPLREQWSMVTDSIRWFKTPLHPSSEALGRIYSFCYDPTKDLNLPPVILRTDTLPLCHWACNVIVIKFNNWKSIPYALLCKSI